MRKPNGTAAKIARASRLSEKNLLPDAHAIARCQIESVSRLNVEGRVPRVDIPHRRCPVLVRGVPVGHHILAQRGIPLLRSPVSREGQKELLVGRKSFLVRFSFARRCRAVSVIRRRNARHVGDVFRQGLLAVQRQVRKWLVSVILRGQLRGRGVEVLDPPASTSCARRLWNRTRCLRCQMCG